MILTFNFHLYEGILSCLFPWIPGMEKSSIRIKGNVTFSVFLQYRKCTGWSTFYSFVTPSRRQNLLMIKKKN